MTRCTAATCSSGTEYTRDGFNCSNTMAGSKGSSVTIITSCLMTGRLGAVLPPYSDEVAPRCGSIGIAYQSVSANEIRRQAVAYRDGRNRF